LVIRGGVDGVGLLVSPVLDLLDKSSKFF